VSAVGDWWDSALPTRKGYRELTPEMLDALEVPVRMIDVREPAEWVGELGHIEGAELVPQARVLEASADWDPAEPVVLICRSGVRSMRAAEALAARGFHKLINLQGGMMAHVRAGLATVR